MQESETKLSDSALLALWAAPILFIAAGMVLLWSWMPPNSFSPFCTYDFAYRLSATISVNGEQLTDSVTYQNAHSRRWIEGMNSGGCQSRDGTALSFRTSGGQVVLIPTRICRDAMYALADDGYKLRFEFYPKDADFAKAMRKGKSVNVKDFCFGVEDDLKPTANWEEELRKKKQVPQAYVVDNWKTPSQWEAIIFGDQSKILLTSAQLVSVDAFAFDESPRDNLEKNAPGLLQSGFEGGGDWWRSPERIISFDRRYSGGFKYTVKNKH